MRLLIKIDKARVFVILKERKKNLDEVNFPLDHDISMKLLPKIDEILKKNKIDAQDIEKAEFSADLSESYTTYRIAKVVVDTFNWAKSQIRS